MAKFGVTASAFSGPLAGVNAYHQIEVSRRKCLKFATTVGLSHLRLAYTDQVALALAAYRAMAIKCAVSFTDSVLRRHAEYKALETSEKANISYWFGMTFTAVAVDQILSVPMLVHAAQFTGFPIARANSKSRSLADLIGKDSSGDFHVIEAKGRHRSAAADERADWKTQAKTIATIDGKAPASTSYCVAFLQRRCRAELIDPPPQGRPVAIQGNGDEFQMNYYKPIVGFVLSGPNHVVKRDGRVVHVRVISYDPQENEYIFLGLDDATLHSVKMNERYGSVSEFEARDMYVGHDGVAIVTGASPCALPS